MRTTLPLSEVVVVGAAVVGGAAVVVCAAVDVGSAVDVSAAVDVGAANDDSAAVVVGASVDFGVLFVCISCFTTMSPRQHSSNKKYFRMLYNITQTKCLSIQISFTKDFSLHIPGCSISHKIFLS